MAGEERHKSLLVLVLYVCIIGSAFSALPVTPLLGLSIEFLGLVDTTSTLDARKTPFWWRLDLIAKISPSSMRAAR